MSPMMPSAVTAISGPPRASGDEPVPVKRGDQVQMSAPRERG